MSPDIQQTSNSRLAQWRGAVEQELQHLITEASRYRKELDTAKTDVKRRYFKKKFTAVTQQVMQMVATLQRLDAHEKSINEDQMPTENTNAEPVSA